MGMLTQQLIVAARPRDRCTRHDNSIFQCQLQVRQKAHVGAEAADLQKHLQRCLLPGLAKSASAQACAVWRLSLNPASTLNSAKVSPPSSWALNTA